MMSLLETFLFYKYMPPPAWKRHALASINFTEFQNRKNMSILNSFHGTTFLLGLPRLKHYIPSINTLKSS